MSGEPLAIDPVAEKSAPCGKLSGRTGNCLILSLRHLGDAVISCGFIRAVQKNNPGMAVDILGRPELKEVSSEFCDFREFIEINFPCFGHHRKDASALKTAIRTMSQVRERRYDYCINTIGDVRENLIGKLTGAKRNIAPVWEKGHLFKNKMTDTGASWIINQPIIIPSSHPSYYESIEYFAKQLGLPGLVWKRTASGKYALGRQVTVALHPGASHPSRHWPEEKWRGLIGELHARGCSIKVLGASVEANALFAAFSREVAEQKLEIVTGDIAKVASCLAAVDVLIGMDSFSVHAAYALGVPAVVLNGSADPAIFTPPGDTTVSAGNQCKHYPCYYAYPCQGTDYEYVCVRGIEISTVISAINKVITLASPVNVP